jgi:hypothetical protein
MKRSWTIRLFYRFLVVTLVIAASLIVGVRARSSKANDRELNSNGEGKCEGSKSQSQFVLWEILTHNLLTSRR